MSFNEKLNFHERKGYARSYKETSPQEGVLTLTKKQTPNPINSPN